jgi:hypothetical protein
VALSARRDQPPHHRLAHLIHDKDQELSKKKHQFWMIDPPRNEKKKFNLHIKILRTLCTLAARSTDHILSNTADTMRADRNGDGSGCGRRPMAQIASAPAKKKKKNRKKFKKFKKIAIFVNF